MLFLLVIFLITFAIFNIYLCNQNVNLRHAINQNSKELQEKRIMNADYENQFYQILDSKKAELLAKEKRLIPEKNPEYFGA